MSENERGFLRPPKRAIDEQSAQYCPVLNLPSKYSSSHWGETITTYLGWSLDEEIRGRASSGGVITSCLCYLLKEGLVDAVMQVGSDINEPLFSRVCFNEDVESVMSCCGSRYVSSSALERIAEAVDSGKRFAAVGRPCEIRALRLLVDSDNSYAEAFPYLFSFFCAGVPSRNAARELESKLNCVGKEPATFRYRGNGWPGFATLTFADGSKSEMTYDESWGKILGRDLEEYCRFCFDGLGEYADVSAGDAWFRREDGKPDFSEHKGRNVVFGRTDKGAELLKVAWDTGLLYLEPFEDWEYLKAVQARQFERKSTLGINLRILKALGHKTLTADLWQLRVYSKALSLRKRLLYAKGMVGRIVKGKISVP